MAIRMRYGTTADTKKKSSEAPAGAKTSYGTFTLNTSRTTVDIGFKPKYLTVMAGSGPSAISTYNADISETQARYSGSSTSTTTYTMASSTDNYRLKEVLDTGFTVNGRASSVTSTAYYYAIGE